MFRKEFAQKLIALGMCPFAFPPFLNETFADTKKPDESVQYKNLKQEKEFIEHWLSDLLDSMEKVLNRDTIVKVVEGCGVACYNHHQFKQDIAQKGKGNLNKLIEAYSKNFEIWQDASQVHIRYGLYSAACYCPAAKNRNPSLMMSIASAPG